MNVYPFSLVLGPVTITGYGLMMMVAFLMAGWAIQLDLRGRGLNQEFASDLILGGVVGGLIGAKLWYVALTGEGLFARGGFVWYGGFIGGVAGVLLVGRMRRVPTWFTLDICAAPLALGYALGRVGCFLVNDDYGLPTTLPWGMKFPHGLPPSTMPNLAAAGASFPPGMYDATVVVAVHPTQLYETIVMFGVFTWLWQRRNRGHGAGQLAGWYFVLASVERFLVEFVRAKDDRVLGGFTLAQAASVAIAIIGVGMLYRARTAANVEPPALRPAAASGSSS